MLSPSHRKKYGLDCSGSVPAGARPGWPAQRHYCAELRLLIRVAPATTTLIDSKSVTDGKHWLAIFEGVQDYEYLLMLKDRLEELRRVGRQDETVAAAQKLLDELPDEVIAAVKAGDIAACDTGRLRVLDMLEALGK